MPADGVTDSLRGDSAEAPATTRDAAQERSHAAAERPSVEGDAGHEPRGGGKCKRE
jgi:hypothetical protein